MLLITLLILTIFLISFAIAGESAAPWVPARKHDVGRFLTAGKVKAGDVVYDLGCGDGRLVAGATTLGAAGRGFEISLLPYLLATIRGLFLKKHRGEYAISFRNFWKVPLGEADVVFLFLMPKVLGKMKEKIQREAKPGTRIVSYVWPLPGLEVTKVNNKEQSPTLYTYVIPTNI